MRKNLLLLCCVISALGGARSQSHEDLYNIVPVRESMRNPGFSPSFLEKQVNRLGDSVGIALLKIYSLEDLQRGDLAKAYLPLIRSAFAYPHLIARTEDRRPDVTLLLLHTLAKGGWSGDLKAEADDLISLLEGRARQAPSRR